ncbi:hypothetical protein Pfo_021813 [Paulownia fortunei]|nr:hypothetical protein Pfo_021813 [Paulownia fortunei]
MRVRGSEVGKMTVLPTLFIGGPRDMYCRYFDKLALVERFEKSNLFITMACNLGWKEIQEKLFVFTELPDQEKHPEDLVAKHIMHGPYGDKNIHVCIIQGKNGYLIYKRRKNGLTVQVRNSQVNNKWIVPYNPYLLSRYNCYINVEICLGVIVVKIYL